MALKGAVRGRQVPKKQCLAERCHGDSQEACIALRERWTLTDLACDVRQSKRNRHPCVREESRRDKCVKYLVDDRGQPVIPSATTGEPQSAEGASSNTPPTASCLSPTSEHGRLREGCEEQWSSSEGAHVSRRLDALQESRMGHSSQSTGKLCTRAQRSQSSPTAKAPSLLKLRTQR